MPCVQLTTTLSKLLHCPQSDRRFASAEGDLVTFLNVWRAWHEADRSKRWCGAHFLNYRNLLRAADIRRQLEFALRCAGLLAERYCHAPERHTCGVHTHLPHQSRISRLSL